MLPFTNTKQKSATTQVESKKRKRHLYMEKSVIYP